ncbi:MAG: ABC transporter substrate-binding protein, partial [Gammaproteobacteria bacterium]|nr:ABC transporter substrate-binding protein [Gammaproteobacteria bacterium]
MRRLLGWLLAVLPLAAVAEDETPHYGGSLNIGTVVVSLSPLSWDPADWVWKINHDTGAVREQLFAGDLEQSVRKGGKHRFIAESYLPDDAWRGELAESWVWEDPLTLAVHLRRGVIFPDKPGVMAARQLTADDVLFTFDYLSASPRRIATYFDHIERLEARGDHTVVFHFSEFNAEWAYRFGYGYYSAIIPREFGTVDGRDWRNVTGTGPFKLARYV